jgi:hypothetical protein
LGFDGRLRHPNGVCEDHRQARQENDEWRNSAIPGQSHLTIPPQQQEWLAKVQLCLADEAGRA